MNDDAFELLTEAMDVVDDELRAAELIDDLPGQIVALRERAKLWRRYGEILTAAGRDSVGAELAAQRDEISADTLARGAM